MSTIFDALFPNELLEISKKIICIKNSYDNSIPKLTVNNGFHKFNDGKTFFNPVRKILIYYKKSDNKKKRGLVFQQLMKFNKDLETFQPELIYGFLANSKNESSNIILENYNIKIMSGETFMKYILGVSYEDYISNVKNEIHSLLNLESN